METESKMTKVCVDLKEDLVSEIDKLAEVRESTRAGIMRLALRDFLKKNKTE
jgi:predicted transcriptional regulator